MVIIFSQEQCSTHITFLALGHLEKGKAAVLSTAWLRIMVNLQCNLLNDEVVADFDVED